MFCINIPEIYNSCNTAPQGTPSYYEHKIGRDARNSVLLEPLEQTLGKLEDIRVRMNSRIEKETASGTDMTSARTLLDIADNSFTVAEQAVALATSTISGDHPHAPYMETQQAYIALGQCKESLNNVLAAIITSVDQASTSVPRQPIHAKKSE